MERTIAGLLALALVLVSGVGHGLWTGRWTVSHEFEAAATSINRIPTAVGEWESQPLQLDQRTLARAEVQGHLVRRFTNRRDGSEVTVLLVCGRSGPISLHTPDVCYEGIGFSAAAKPTSTRLQAAPGDPPAEFKTALFQKRGAAIPESLIVFWSWNATGVWETPDHPRLKFASFPVLYKLYVIRNMGSANLEREAGIVKAFIAEFLPEIERALFPKMVP